MSPNTRKRVALYGVGVLLLAGLAYGGFIYEADPSYGQLVGSAQACAQYGSPDEGIRWAERALAIDPDDRFVHLILARCYLRKEDYERAAESYGQSIELTPDDDPNRDVLVLHRAQALASGDRLDEAIRDVTAVTERSPDLLVGWYTLGKLHLSRGENEPARAAFTAAAERAPDDFEPLALLGSVEEARGNRNAARAHYREAERRAQFLSAEKLEKLGSAKPTPENEPQRDELTTLYRKHAEITLGLARLDAAEGAVDAAEDWLVAAAGLDRRLTSRSVRTEALFAPYRDSERLRAALTGSVEKK